MLLMACQLFVWTRYFQDRLKPQNSFFARPHQIAAFSKHVRISFSVGSQVGSLRQTVV